MTKRNDRGCIYFKRSEVKKIGVNMKFNKIAVSVFSVKQNSNNA